jgi:hypothetical protein
MALPEVKTTIRDGALGIVPDNTNGVQAKIGSSSLGTVNVPVAVNDLQTLKDTFGTGPLVEAAAVALNEAGGPVICVRVTSATGTMGSMTATKTGTATLAITGGTLDAYRLRIEIIQGGATLTAGTATFRYSLDGGATYSGELAVPTSGVYVIPGTGMTITWTYTSGTAFVAADNWVGTGTGPTFSLSDAMLAADALLADTTNDFAFVHVVGAPATPGDAATFFASFATKMEGAATTLYRYARGIMETPDDTDANQKTAFASAASTRIGVAAGYAALSSPISQVSYQRNAAWSISARLGRIPAGEDAGWPERGPLTGVTSLTRDENKTPGLDAARFMTLRTIVGIQGAYVTNARLFSATGSDFEFFQHGRVMDIGSKIVRREGLRLLNSSVRVNATTGTILEQDAVSIETKIESALNAVLLHPGHVSAISVQVDRTTNILSTKTLTIRQRITPLGYAKFIQNDIGFKNPALQQVGAAA